MRRCGNERIKISDILNNKKINFREFTNGIIVTDDLKCINYDDIQKVLAFFNELTQFRNNLYINIINCRPTFYDHLIRYIKTNKPQNLSFSVKFDTNEIAIKDIFELSDEIVAVEFDEKKLFDNIWTIAPENRYKIKQISHHFPYEGDMLTCGEMINATEYIAKQISYYAQNDLQAILLLDKALRENTSYDTHYYYHVRPTLEEGSQHLDKAHHLSTLFTHRTVVCNVYALFAELLFKHPDFPNIEIKNVHGTVAGDGHAWNEIKLNGLWYMHDFTHNVWFDKDNGMRCTLVKSNRQKEDDIGPVTLNEMPRNIILNEYEKIKDIHIKFPTIEEIKSERFPLPTSRRRMVPTLHPNNTRRKATVIYPLGN